MKTDNRKMEGDDLHKVPITALTFEAVTLLKCLLNPTKVLLSTDRLLRDWRGLANLVGIPSDITSAFEQQDNKCAKVIQYWQEKRDGTANIGQLLEYMRKMDRFDVVDDFMNLSDGNRLFLKQLDRPTNQALALRGQVSQWYQHPSHDENIITFDDKIHGCLQTYHGYILYAREDREFAMEMVQHMSNKYGCKLCTEEDLIPGPTSVYTLVIRLIASGRCHWIVPIFSEDFLRSSVNTFYTSYTQALAMESRRPRSIPCLYRECTLPAIVRSTLVLYYNSNMYNFWQRLMVSLIATAPAAGYDAPEPNYSSVKIVEIKSSQQMWTSFRNARFIRWINSLLCSRRRTEIVRFRAAGNSN